MERLSGSGPREYWMEMGILGLLKPQKMIIMNGDSELETIAGVPVSTEKLIWSSAYSRSASSGANDLATVELLQDPVNSALELVNKKKKEPSLRLLEDVVEALGAPEWQEVRRAVSAAARDDASLTACELITL
eukprot:gnl/TRDRNA2_/TRDRNA2_88940_c2_seq1.p2 gnl/TRDRNA2_/TRDRNA2_88940_c2~~gnl/TRDRNA2_/TRDRNA2_88940_c2_seq1.p2  ORF type:complete len:133 (+),score=22.15 gnl/TRDRNA2_/TRDRNA2_88940_c2_seq1:186-584(+)